MVAVPLTICQLPTGTLGFTATLNSVGPQAFCDPLPSTMVTTGSLSTIKVVVAVALQFFSFTTFQASTAV